MTNELRAHIEYLRKLYAEDSKEEIESLVNTYTMMYNKVNNQEKK